MSEILPPDIEHASIGFPTVFADGVASVAPSNEVIKFYLSRLEPHFFAKEPVKNQPVAQVIMPISGFVNTAVFFQRVLESLKASGVVSDSQIEDAKNAFDK